MFTYTGGATVKQGFYFDARNWRFEMIEAASGTLPGDGAGTYVRVPTLAMFLVAPIMGALFIVFLPFVGFALLGEWAWKSITGMSKAPSGSEQAPRA